MFEGHCSGMGATDLGLREEFEYILQRIKVLDVEADIVLYSLQAEVVYPPPAAEMKKLNAEHVAYKNPWRKHSLQGSNLT